MDSLTSILKQKQCKNQRFFLTTDLKSTNILCREGRPGEISFSNGTSCLGKCIGCESMPCIYYSLKEIKNDCSFKDFPADTDNRVCASNAIIWDSINSRPVINSTECVMCGACISRCPTKALYFSTEKAVRCDSPASNDPFFHLAQDSDYESVNNTIQMLKETPVHGEMLKGTEYDLDRAYSVLLDVAKTMGPQFPNLLARNLLNTVGIKASIRRRGDVYLRTDLVFENGQKQGLCEIEFFPEVMLDAPRDILDDMAVFISRYGLDKQRIQPLIIGLELPNQRSEYWQVIEDIKNVLGAKIATLTIGGLLLLAWKYKTINLSRQELPYADDKSFSIRNGLSRLLETRLTCLSSRFSLFESQK